MNLISQPLCTKSIKTVSSLKQRRNGSALKLADVGQKEHSGYLTWHWCENTVLQIENLTGVSYLKRKTTTTKKAYQTLPSQ